MATCTCNGAGGRYVWFGGEDDGVEEWEPCDCVAMRDALLDAANDERFGLPAWEAQWERDREARPVPAGLDGVPW